MMKPKIYNSEGVLQNFIRKSSDMELVKYIRSIYVYIDVLERKVDIEDMTNTSNEDSDYDVEDNINLIL